MEYITGLLNVGDLAESVLGNCSGLRKEIGKNEIIKII